MYFKSEVAYSLHIFGARSRRLFALANGVCRYGDCHSDCDDHSDGDCDDDCDTDCDSDCDGDCDSDCDRELCR